MRSDGIHPMSIAELSCAYMLSFRSVAYCSFFSGKCTIFDFYFNTVRGVEYRHADGVPLMTLILNRYGFFGSSSIIFSGRSTIFGVFLIQEGMRPYRYAHNIPLMTLILNTYGFVDLTSTVQV